MRVCSRQSVASSNYLAFSKQLEKNSTTTRPRAETRVYRRYLFLTNLFSCLYSIEGACFSTMRVCASTSGAAFAHHKASTMCHFHVFQVWFSRYKLRTQICFFFLNSPLKPIDAVRVCSLSAETFEYRLKRVHGRCEYQRAERFEWVQRLRESP